MKTFLTPFIVTVTALTAFSFNAPAQLLIDSASQTRVIDFQSSIGWDNNASTPTDDTPGDNVFKFEDPNSSRLLAERENSVWRASWNNRSAPSADAFSWSASNQDLGGGTDARTPFGDYNGDNDFGDELGNIPNVSWTTLDTLGLGTSTDHALDIGTGGRPFRSYTLTLRVQNTSGSTISSWEFGMDTWYSDDDDSSADVGIMWSTDNVNFTGIDSFTTTDTGETTDYVERDLSGSFNAAVNDGEYLYLQFYNNQAGGNGSGAGVVVDNWSVTSIPEPSSAALILGVLGAIVLFRRRRGF